MFEGIPWRLWVKRRRKALDLTQQEVAERVAYSPEMIGQVERGLQRPSPELAILLADTLEVPAEARNEFIRAARAATSAARTGKAVIRSRALSIPATRAAPLLGRTQDATRVYEALTRPRQRLVTITGPAGVGKTSLAMHIARGAQTLYPGGVFWAALVALRDPLLVFNAVAQALGIKSAGDQSLPETIEKALEQRQVLLVLDNCEQVEGMVSVVADLLAAPGLQILATSRRRLRVRGEQQISLTSLGLPSLGAHITAEEVGKYPGLALFLQRARQTMPGLRLTAAMPPLSCRYAGLWTVCRWDWRWPPRVFGRCRRPRCWHG